MAGLPISVRFTSGEFSLIVEPLEVSEPGDLTIELVDENGAVAATSNPMRVSHELSLRPYWGDLHGQSEETIGTNSARDFHAFARDNAFLDATAHQGNDFQISTEFWAELNKITAEFKRGRKIYRVPRL